MSMPKKLDRLLQHAEDVIDELNNHRQAMVVRAVFKMKDKARACVAVDGGVLKGRKVSNCVGICSILDI